MSFKSSLLKIAIKIAIKVTPNKMVLWVANTVLKGIAELTDFSFDIDTRKVYVQTTLYGETEAIEVWLEDFAIASDGQSYQFIMHHARSNRPWLTNILAHIVGKAWKIPAIPQLNAHMALIAELFKEDDHPKLEND
jgi:hypothetical protein